RKTLAGQDVEIDALQRGGGCPAGAVGHRKPGEAGESFGHARALRFANASASPSENRWTPSTVTISARPGRIDRNGAERKTLRPSDIIEPQVTMLGSLRPRKERAASMSTELATMTELSASTGGNALGRISRSAISSGRMPTTRAAET